MTNILTFYEMLVHFSYVLVSFFLLKIFLQCLIIFIHLYLGVRQLKSCVWGVCVCVLGQLTGGSYILRWDWPFHLNVHICESFLLGQISQKGTV